MLSSTVSPAVSFSSGFRDATFALREKVRKSCRSVSTNLSLPLPPQLACSLDKPTCSSSSSSSFTSASTHTTTTSSLTSPPSTNDSSTFPLLPCLHFPSLSSNSASTISSASPSPSPLHSLPISSHSKQNATPFIPSANSQICSSLSAPSLKNQKSFSMSIRNLVSRKSSLDSINPCHANIRSDITSIQATSPVETSRRSFSVLTSSDKSYSTAATTTASLRPSSQPRAPSFSRSRLSLSKHFSSKPDLSSFQLHDSSHISHHRDTSSSLSSNTLLPLPPPSSVNQSPSPFDVRQNFTSSSKESSHSVPDLRSVITPTIPPTPHRKISRPASSLSLSLDILPPNSSPSNTSFSSVIDPRSKCLYPLQQYPSVAAAIGITASSSSSSSSFSTRSHSTDTALPPSQTSFDHSLLRNAVGSCASLLDYRQTIEMYRTNLKKTNDVSIQYDFALFLVQLAAELLPSQHLNQQNYETRLSFLREARNILQRLSDRGYASAQYYLADGYASGLFNKDKADWDKAFPLFVAATKHGHAEAAYRAGLCYEFGWGCRKDYAKAVQFYRASASKNHPGAATRLGKACLTGAMGLSSRRRREGLKWLKRAQESADQQYNEAPYELALLHETGYADDIFKDERYASELFLQSAELGHPEACFKMGHAYEFGLLNCMVDPARSIHFYTIAAQAGLPKAMMALCAWYTVGAEPYIPRDPQLAFEWATQAAQCGYPKAEYAVGYFTEIGLGCPEDSLLAYAWYLRAAQKGDQRALKKLQLMRTNIQNHPNPSRQKSPSPPHTLQKRTINSSDSKLRKVSGIFDRFIPKN